MSNSHKHSPQIIPIAIFPMGMINAFLIRSQSGCILVDSGLPNTENKIGLALKKLGLQFTDIKLIIITHAHIDHAGNAALIKKYSGAPILAHQGDLPFYQGEKSMHFCSTGWFGKLFSKTGAIQKPYQSFTPDILLQKDQSFNLNKFGLNAHVITTPGHTDGSISVLIENKDAIVGDLISSGILLGGIIRKHKAKRPPFEDNPLLVSQQLQYMLNEGYLNYFMGHGGPLTADEVNHHIKFLRKISTN